MIRFSDEWLTANNRDKDGKLLKGRRVKRGDGIPDATAGHKRAVAKLHRLEIELAVSPHAKALAQLAKNPEVQKKKGPEHWDQVRVFDFMHRKHPDIYDLLHATPNGGARSEVVGFDMKAEGLKKGFPDVSLHAARGVYHGLHVELKVGSNSLQEDQKKWQARLRAQGYACELTKGWEAMTEIILRYWLLETGQTL